MRTIIKKSARPLLAFMLVFMFAMTVQSCKTGEGCGQTDQSESLMDKPKKSKSNLFSKKQRKKITKQRSS